ncbi:sodium-translocating pyrophosphatase [bacterium]|nr:sodium-translocating pyrophosphatase [bacterium]
MENVLLAANPEIPVSSWLLWWLVSLGSSLAGLYFALKFYREMKQADPGDADMIRVAGFVTEGAKAYLAQQYRVVTIVFVIIATILAALSHSTGQSMWIPIAFLTGGFFSTLAGYFGMMTATAASNRTAAAARTSLNKALQVAFRSGAVMGLSVVGFGLFNCCFWFFFLWVVMPAFGYGSLSLVELTSTLLSAGLGASTQALFARVGGGIFTKAADVGADLVGKVESGIPEDDPRNPATIADNVGDNVGDVAGMGADLFESYCGSILAAAALAVSAFSLSGEGSGELQMSGVILPFAIAGVGILVSIFGVYFVKTEEGASQKELLHALERGINLSAILGAATGMLLTVIILGFSYWGVAIALGIGVLSGVLIAMWTGYATSDAFGPTQRIADQAEFGPATVIISGIAEGMQSTWMPTLIVGLGTIMAYGFSTGFDFTDPGLMSLGLYGIGLAAVGMLSTLGITLASDAYGPIADNAGGNAEMTHQDPSVREKTDALDKLGNTTAAIGKGFAIGSAALTALALLAAYIEQVRITYDQLGKTKIASVLKLEEKSPDEYKKLMAEAVKDGISLRSGSNVVIGKNLFVPGKGKDEPATKNAAAPEAAPAAQEPAMQTYLRFRLDPNRPEIGYRFAPIGRATIRDFVDLLDINPMNPKMLVGVMVGAMLVLLFSAMTMNAVGRSAGQMVAEVRRQFKEIPGIMAGTAEPDYAACVRISTQAAQYEMLMPSILGLSAPVVGGLCLGVAGTVGILAGSVSTGFVVAIMMANAGGAWDNAKKYIEGGAHGGKGSPAHKAGVVGDTVGDPFKDTSGPSLNILIKLMSMVAVVFTGLILQFGL